MTYTKLIERLSELQGVIAKGGTTRLPDSETVREAADAVEALQAENERLKREKQIEKENAREWWEQADALAAKLDAAPKALEPLTDEQIKHIFMCETGWSISDSESLLFDFARAIEAAHGITKGTP